MTTDRPKTKKDSEEITLEKVEKMANDLSIKLPKETLSLAMRVITLIMVIGGLSILGSVFTDFSVPKNDGFILYFYRMLTGFSFLAIAYGFYTRRRWAVWLYGAIVLVGLIINFALTLIPAVLAVYLYTQRKMLRPGYLDKVVVNFWNSIKPK